MNRLKNLLFVKNFEYLEIMSGFGAIGWGVALILSPHLFDKRVVYESLKVIIQYESIWGLMAIVLGLLEIYLVYKNTFNRMFLRRTITLFIAGFWIFVTLVFSIFSRDSILLPSAGIYTTLALGTCWAYIRLSIYHRSL